jgi:SLT domain-containing protein
MRLVLHVEWILRTGAVELSRKEYLQQQDESRITKNNRRSPKAKVKRTLKATRLSGKCGEQKAETLGAILVYHAQAAAQRFAG